LRSGEFPQKAIDLINSRVVRSGQLQIPADTTLITLENKDVNDHNFLAPHFSQSVNKKVYRLSAIVVHGKGVHATPVPTNHPIFSNSVVAGIDKDGLLPHLDMRIGDKFSILEGNKNLGVAGVGNGTTGVWIGVLPPNALDDCTEASITLPDTIGTEATVLIPKVSITHLLLRILDSVAPNTESTYSARQSFRYYGCPHNVYPVARITKKSNSRAFNVSQFPIRHTHAFTVYKAQGQTMKRVIMAVGTGANMAYVASSRVCRLQDLFFLKPFSKTDQQKCGVSEIVRKVMRHLIYLETLTLTNIVALQIE
jgi:hypothetical protein